MDVRGKLVELVKRAIIDWEHGDASEWIADHLISNGVTVQEWISVGRVWSRHGSAIHAAARSIAHGMRKKVLTDG